MDMWRTRIKIADGKEEDNIDDSVSDTMWISEHFRCIYIL